MGQGPCHVRGFTSPHPQVRGESHTPRSHPHPAPLLAPPCSRPDVSQSMEVQGCCLVGQLGQNVDGSPGVCRPPHQPCHSPATLTTAQTRRPALASGTFSGAFQLDGGSTLLFCALGPPSGHHVPSGLSSAIFLVPLNTGPSVSPPGPILGCCGRLELLSSPESCLAHRRDWTGALAWASPRLPDGTASRLPAGAGAHTARQGRWGKPESSRARKMPTAGPPC